MSERLVNDPFFNTLLVKDPKKEDPLEKLITQRYNKISERFDSLEVHPSFDFVDSYFNINNKAEFICFFDFLFNNPVDELSEKQAENLRKKKKRKKGYRL